MEAEAALAQDLCARLCHDLVGPLGTVAGAIDLLAEDPEAAELARDAAAVLRRRLKFWRAACGAGTGPLSLQEVQALLEGMLAGGRATLQPESLPESEVLGAAEAQLLLSGAMLAGEALPRGGVVRLRRGGGGSLVLQPEGRSAAWPPVLAALLAAPEEE
ncbi:histidine phosphotransferase family protein, partial [Roseomonas sp. GC11]|uniref:histidine phosphotransferase family protein n=1 Tax=Roseomonas sp. GC11 TaxID=2950546 RepID=UPI00210E8449